MQTKADDLNKRQRLYHGLLSKTMGGRLNKVSAQFEQVTRMIEKLNKDAGKFGVIQSVLGVTPSVARGGGAALPRTALRSHDLTAELLLFFRHRFVE